MCRLPCSITSCGGVLAVHRLPHARNSSTLLPSGRASVEEFLSKLTDAQISNGFASPSNAWFYSKSWLSVHRNRVPPPHQRSAVTIDFHLRHAQATSNSICHIEVFELAKSSPDPDTLMPVVTGGVDF